MEWKEIKISEIIHSGNTGLDAIKRAPIVENDTGIKCLRIQDVSQAKAYHDWGFTNVERRNFDRFQLKKHDIIIARTGASIGVNCIIKNDLLSVFNNGLIRLRANKKLCDSTYLYYNFRTSDYYSHIDAISGGTSTQPNMQINALLDYKINLPPLPEQRAIAEILSSIDDKIELNNQMNRTLEATAQAIFKQWFVDFEFPFDFAQGKPITQASASQLESMSNRVAEVNNIYKVKKADDTVNPLQSGEGGPLAVGEVGYKSSGGKMIDSELGQIPEGWESVYYTDIINVLGGGTPSKKNDNYWNGTIPFFTPKDIEESAYIFNTEEYITEEGLRNCNSKLYKKNSVFITARGTVGKICMTGLDMAMNQSCYALIGSDGFNQYYVYEQTLDLISRLKQNSHGSVFNTITTDTFRKIKITKPDFNILSIYEFVVSPLFDEIHNNTMQSQTLSTLRDSLLPKLMSGELRVPEEIVKSFEETV